MSSDSPGGQCRPFLLCPPSAAQSSHWFRRLPQDADGDVIILRVWGLQTVCQYHASSQWGLGRGSRVPPSRPRLCHCPRWLLCPPVVPSSVILFSGLCPWLWLCDRALGSPGVCGPFQVSPAQPVCAPGTPPQEWEGDFGLRVGNSWGVLEKAAGEDPPPQAAGLYLLHPLLTDYSWIRFDFSTSFCSSF